MVLQPLHQRQVRSAVAAILTTLSSGDPLQIINRPDQQNPARVITSAHLPLSELHFTNHFPVWLLVPDLQWRVYCTSIGIDWLGKHLGPDGKFKNRTTEPIRPSRSKIAWSVILADPRLVSQSYLLI